MARSILLKNIPVSRPSARLTGVGHIISFYGLSKLIHAPRVRCLSSTAIRERNLVTSASRDEALIKQLHDPGMDTIDKAVRILTPAFLSDPVYTWFLNHVPPSQHQEKLATLFRAVLTQAALNNGVLIEAGNFGCCGLVMPPGSRLESPQTLLQAGLLPALWTLGLGTFKVRLPTGSSFDRLGQMTDITPPQRAMFELPQGVRSIHERSLTAEERKNHWYGVVMGTAAGSRRQGLGSCVFSHMLDRARNDRKPLCFEAATASNRDLYLRHGSKILGEFVVGKGKVGIDGMRKRGGEGLKIWSMIWRP